MKANHHPVTAIRESTAIVTPPLLGEACGALPRRRYAGLGLPLILFLALTLASGAWAQTNGTPARLAIISETDDFAPVADLLTVELSAKPQLQVLERAQIEKLYREQQLSAANRDYVKLGQVLGADGLLLLGKVADGTNDFVSVRLVAVKPGVVIGNFRTAWPVEDTPGWAKWAANHFTPLLPKLTVSAKDAIPISVVNLRSAVRSVEAQDLERQLTVLLIERLTRERELFVLERRRMDLLSAEKELQGMGESAFWNGSYMLDGTIDRDGYSKDTMTIHARLAPSKGGALQLIDISSDRGNSGDAVSRIVKAIIDALKLGSPAQPWSPADEAEQYFVEGTWAYRWKMWPEAQAASESAWALGQRTGEVAALRVGAYGGAILPERILGNIEIPAVPKSANLQTAIRTLSLFCQSQDLARSATNFLDVNWIELGLDKALRPAAAVLDGYYHAAELRRGNEEQLAELRALAREVAAMLETNLPPSRALEFQRGVRSPPGNERERFNKWRESTQLWKMRDTLWTYQWEQGGVWYDKPEDALPMFQRVLETGHHPSSLPRVIGWNWTDRKRVPGVVKQLVQQVHASTNPALRLEGLYLALVRAPFDGQRQDRRCLEDLMAAMWAERERSGSAYDLAGLLQRTEGTLEHKYYVWSSPVAVEPFATFKTRFNLELAKAIAQSNAVRQAETRLATNTFSGRSTNRPVWPAEKPLVVKFIHWTLRRSQSESTLEPKLVDVLVRDGKLWSSVQICRTNAMFTEPRTLVFVMINPTTGASEELAFPTKISLDDGRFALNTDSLFTMVREHIQRYQFRSRAWEQIAVPISGGARLLAVSNQLYVATSEALFEFSPESGDVQILVSARRNPPMNELDKLWKPGAAILPTPDGQLGLRLGDELHTFNPGNRAWARIASLQFLHGKMMYRGSWTREFASDAGLFLLRAMGEVQLFALWHGTEALDPLLVSYSGVAWRPLTPLPTRWNWPEGFSLFDSCTLARDRTLWVLCPRRTGFAHNEERVEFKDERMATFAHFQPEHPEALCVPIQFEQDGKLIDPFGGSPPWQFSPGENRPFWLEMPEGFVFAVPAALGHWLIPKDALETRLQVLRKNLRASTQRESRPFVTPPSPGVTNAETTRVKQPALEALMP